MPPIQSDKLYDSWYECSRAAHTQSLKILQKSGYVNVNRYKFGIKYNCKVADTI